MTDVAPAAQSTAIGFSTLNNRVTKSANDDAADYMVYALVNGTSDAWYIAGETVDDENSLTSGKVYYWPSAGSLDFYAYAPAESDNLIPNVTAASSIELTYTVPSTANEDFTIATPVTAATYNSTVDGEVDFTFSHVLTKITINIQLSDKLFEDGYTFDLTSATFNAANEGLVIDPMADNSATLTVSTETAGTTPYAYELKATKADDTVEGAQELLIAPNVGTETEACSIDLSGLIVYNENGVAAYTAAAAVQYSFETTQAFAAGSSYAITITVDLDDVEIGLKVITFTADIETNDWSDTNVGLSDTDM
ncbi:MAG: fimbrillin family protein [Rikenellaceae bacterium]